MVHLTKASQELFRREPDEMFSSIDSLVEHCRNQRETSVDQWLPPATLSTKPVRTDQLVLSDGDDTSYIMNDWSFGQLCRLAGVTKETVKELIAALQRAYKAGDLRPYFCANRRGFYSSSKINQIKQPEVQE